MFLRAKSLALQTTCPKEFARRVRKGLESVQTLGSDGSTKPGGALIFTAGRLSEAQLPLAEELADQCSGVVSLIVGGNLVASESSEPQEQSAATALVWRGRFPPRLSTRYPEATTASPEADPLALVFSSAKLSYTTAAAAVELPGQTANGILGGGSVGEPGVVGVSASGQTVVGDFVGLTIPGAGATKIRSVTSCRHLGPLLPITEAKGSLLLQIGEESALKALSRLGRQLSGQQLMVVLSTQADSRNPSERTVVCPVTGIDPEAGGLTIDREFRIGDLATLAVLDQVAGNAKLQHECQSLLRQMAGAAPLCAICLKDNSRTLAGPSEAGSKLRVLSNAFSGVPIVGAVLPYQWSSASGVPLCQRYADAFALFSSPS